jgi:hypothetical protein
VKNGSVLVKVGAGIAVVAVAVVVWLGRGTPERTNEPSFPLHVQSRSGGFPAGNRPPVALRGGDLPNPDEGVQARLFNRKPWSRDGREPPGRNAAGPATEPEEENDERTHLEALTHTALHDPDPTNRIDALNDLMNVDEEQSRPILVAAVSDRDPKVRLAAVEQISFQLGEDAPFDTLALAVRDSDPAVRAEALRALDDLDDPRKGPLIHDALGDPDEDVRTTAMLLDDTADEASDAEDGGS